jgi:hypothetical protein
MASVDHDAATCSVGYPLQGVVVTVGIELELPRGQVGELDDNVGPIRWECVRVGASGHTERRARTGGQRPAAEVLLGAVGVLEHMPLATPLIEAVTALPVGVPETYIEVADPPVAQPGLAFLAVQGPPTVVEPLEDGIRTPVIECDKVGGSRILFSPGREVHGVAIVGLVAGLPRWERARCVIRQRNHRAICPLHFIERIGFIAWVIQATGFKPDGTASSILFREEGVNWLTGITAEGLAPVRACKSPRNSHGIGELRAGRWVVAVRSVRVEIFAANDW